MSEVEEIPIKHLGDLLENCRPAQDDSLAQLYRGHKNASWTLKPDLYRLQQLPVLWPSWQRLETELLRRFRLRSHGYLNGYRPSGGFEWMALGRHHGLPTRLLDWSTSPVTALWFAVADLNSKDDACVWQISTSETWFPEALRSLDEFVPAHGIAKVMPPHISPRITAQSGVFTMHTHPEGSEPFVALEEQVNTGTARPSLAFYLRKFTIAAEFRPTLKLELSTIGVGPSSIYPSLDGVADDVRWSLERALLVENNAARSR